jgi:radical SAM protein with 4Fe4S-binding SPASM domain
LSPSSNPVFHFTKPSLHDVREERHLLVWGRLATWMVMDDEFVSLLGRFDGASTLGAVVAKHAEHWNRSAQQVVEEAEPLLQDLVNRGVLTSTPGPPAQMTEPVEIANITLNLTNRCNLSCPFCYNGDRAGAEIPVEKIVCFLEAGEKVMSSDASLIILGGEPTIDPKRLLEFLDNAGPLFSRAPMISTNGTLLDDELVGELAARRVEVQVSLDSHRLDAHDAGRGDGVYATATEGIARLVAAGVHTIVSMVLQRSNTEDMEGYLRLAMDLGVNEARFIPLRNAGAAGDHDPGAAPDRYAAFENLLDILARRPEFSRLLVRDFFSISMIQCRYTTSRVSCGIARRVIFIDADGEVYPCPNHVAPGFALGNVATDSLQHVLRDCALANELRDRYRVDHYTRCRDCPFSHWCAGDCRGEVLAVSGDPAAPSPHCKEQRAMYTRMLWLLANGDPRLVGLPKQPAGKAAKDTFMV